MSAALLERGDEGGNILAAVELKEGIGLAVKGLDDLAELAQPASEVGEVVFRDQTDVDPASPRLQAVIGR